MMCMENVIIGGGCFWCTEGVMNGLKGVLEVSPGYCGGHVENPTYEQVCRKKTGHAEVVKVTYDSKIINLKTGIIANCLKNIKGDSIATIGTNRKLLIFKINELPELNKGKGVRLQKYKNAYLSDITSFDSEIGLVWFDKSGRKNVLSNFEDWVGKRAQSGKIAPKGFPRNNNFNLN